MTQSYGSVDETSDSVEWDLAARSHLERSEESDSITSDTRALQSVAEIPVCGSGCKKQKQTLKKPKKENRLWRLGRVGREEMVS
jgi:hypothetical protein